MSGNSGISFSLHVPDRFRKAYGKAAPGEAPRANLPRQAVPTTCSYEFSILRTSISPLSWTATLKRMYGTFRRHMVKTAPPTNEDPAALPSAMFLSDVTQHWISPKVDRWLT